MPSVSPVLVHDYLLVHRGAERTFAAMAACWPGAPVATLLYDSRTMARHLPGHPVRTSRLQRLGADQRTFRSLLPLYPFAAERLPVSGHPVVVSSSSAFAHGVRPDAGAVHVSYCYTPFRYAWFEEERALAELPRLARPVLRRQLARMRRWDLAAAARVTEYIAISEVSRERIHRAYGRDATVIHPPVETHRFAPGTPEDFFLIVSELVPHKRVDLALEATERVGARVRVVGGGPELERLRARFVGTAEFLGRLSDADVAALMPRALALIVPTFEEFGIAAVEAQAAGRPVIAPAAGGTGETVLDGVTGVLLARGDVDEFAEALREVDFNGFDADAAVRQAARFSTRTFQQALVARVAAACT